MVDDTPVISLDHQSSSPLDPRVRGAMIDAIERDFGNPDSLSEDAREAAEAIELARTEVAALIGAAPSEVVFTGGDVESRNLAVQGLWRANRHRGDHIVRTAVDHDAIAHSCRTLETDGADVSVAVVDSDGRIDQAGLLAAMREDTITVHLPHGQHEVGTVNDVEALCGAVRDRWPEAIIHVDATATAGLVLLSPITRSCDAISIGGASMGGPRWVGALWIREGTRLHPLMSGGLQEKAKRPGYHDIPSIVGLGRAAAIARGEGADRAATMRRAADRLTARLTAIDGVRLNGHPLERIPGHVHVGADGVEGDALAAVLATRGIICSPGSVCASIGKSSAVLEAMGRTPPASLSGVLFTLSHTTTDDMVDSAAHEIAKAIAHLRDIGVRA